MLGGYTPETNKIIQMREQDLLREAEQDRLLRQAREASPRLYRRVLASVGSLLIATGEKLQGSYALTRPSRADAT